MTFSIQPDEIITFRGCPQGCAIYHERKVGKHGAFYFCHRCKNTISEHPKGGVDQSCGVCTICHGLLFWRTLPNGIRFKACWSPQKHISVLGDKKAS